ncbi:aminodeoxychorismate lyase [Billgrantia montanilacus]|uniref:Aminodeoxychorismate lyase n=1 Tax=Billgrantia montanilacus TaxID=2282305 RepID=A0A368TUX0_9GAMM|nr:aminodeoxychorismate lyase [Halomonas montanilacus]RCV87842.1 aminodeoxychorismate lyase [Halomonas montanilacus]
MSLASEQSSVPMDDRGLAYGDGLFETVLVRDGTPLLWDEHMARLARGCQVLGIPLPARDALDCLPERAGPGLRVLKLILTRGSGGRGYLPPASSSPRLRWQAMAFSPQPSRWRDGVRVRHCRLRLGIQPLLAGLKHLNRLENVLARNEWSAPDLAEGLLCNSDGWLVEATCMNLFWLREGQLETPRLDDSGVAGTLRAALLERLPVSEVMATPDVLAGAEAVWLANSIQGVWPVAQLDDAGGTRLANWTIGRAHRHLQAAAHDLLDYPVDFPE